MSVLDDWIRGNRPAQERRERSDSDRERQHGGIHPDVDEERLVRAGGEDATELRDAAVREQDSTPKPAPIADRVNASVRNCRG